MRRDLTECCCRFSVCDMEQIGLSRPVLYACWCVDILLSCFAVQASNGVGPPPMPNVPVNYVPGTRVIVCGLLWWVPPEGGWVSVREATPTDAGLVLALTWLVLEPHRRWARQYHIRGLLTPQEGGQGGWHLLPQEDTVPRPLSPPPPRDRWAARQRDPTAGSTRDPSPPEVVDRATLLGPSQVYVQLASTARGQPARPALLRGQPSGAGQPR